MHQMLVRILLPLWIMILFIAPAMAQIGPAAGEVDFAPLADMAVSALGAVLAGVASLVVAFVGKKAHDWFGIRVDDSQRALLETALHRGINWGEERIRGAYDGKLTIAMKSELLAMGASYLVARTPDALKRFGIDPNTESGRRALQELVESRLHSNVFDDDPRNDRDPEKMVRPPAPVPAS